MAGLGLHISTTGSLEIMALAGESTAARLMLAGFLINAAAPPVSGWLSDAYPEGSFSGTVFLSAFSTNTAVYALLRMGPGLEVLVWLGAFMAIYSVIRAAVEVDMRRILAFAIINQIGVMLCGVGLGSDMAVNGVSAHAVSHVVSLSLLLMTAGSVLHMTGRRTLTELGGLYRYMPVTTVCAIIGVLALSVPGTAGFVSRSLILNAAAEAHQPVLRFILMGASAALFAFPGLRFVWYVFFAGRAPREGADLTDPPGLMQAAMVLLALLGLGIGLYPPLLYDLLPTPVTYVPYTVASVVGMAQLLLFCGLAFFFSRRFLSPARTKITLDLDVVWRKWIPAFGHVAFSAGRFVDNAVRRGTLLGVRCLMLEFVEDAKRIEAIQIGGAVVWGAVLLMFSLVFYVL